MTDGRAEYRYEFPPQTPQAVADWQRQVGQALEVHTLNWQHTIDTQWILSGQCPRCDHDMSNYFDLDVVIAGPFFDAATYAPTGDEARSQFQTEVVCTCHAEPPHRKDTAGCGYGKGLQIAIPSPREA